jgi:hypothetical protein
MDVETLALEEDVTDRFRSVAATAVGRILITLKIKLNLVRRFVENSVLTSRPPLNETVFGCVIFLLILESL